MIGVSQHRVSRAQGQELQLYEKRRKVAKGEGCEVPCVVPPVEGENQGTWQLADMASPHQCWREDGDVDEATLGLA